MQIKMARFHRWISLSAMLLLAGIAGKSAKAQTNTLPLELPDGKPGGNARKPHATQANRGGQTTVVVLGSGSPIPLSESARVVEVEPLHPGQFMLATPLDPLRNDASIFLEQRGAGGAQTDLTLRGGSFEQTLVLLNGFRINDSQTAHHNLDLPLPMEAMDSIQVLHGAGSTLHGVDALSGVVDFLTAAPRSNSIEASAGFGSFGENEQSLMVELLRQKWSSRITGTHNLSTGFMYDRDYRNETASDEDWIESRLGLTDILLAGSDRSFGANQFYGPYPSWERTKGWFGSIRQELGKRTEADFGYRRHTDEFVLLRNDPAVYENNHIDGSWQASLHRAQNFGPDTVLLTGMEADGDSIHSNNLGNHARNRAAGYVDVDLNPVKHRWGLSAGAREEGFSGGLQMVFAPNVAASYRLTNTLKLRGSIGYGFRIPTYTDLYYSDPTTIGDPNLLPESAWSSEAGFDWNPGSRFSFSATGFDSQQHNTIDYVRASAADRWQATNLNGFSFKGVETSATIELTRTQELQLDWTNLYGAQSALHGLQSEYIFNYPVENAHMLWTMNLRNRLRVRNSLQVAQRYQQTAYPVWDLAFEYDAGARQRWRPYLRLANLSNTGYQEIEGVAMPGRSITGGVTYLLGLH